MSTSQPSKEQQQKTGQGQQGLPPPLEQDRSKGLNPDQRGPAQPDEDRDGPVRRD